MYASRPATKVNIFGAYLILRFPQDLIATIHLIYFFKF